MHRAKARRQRGTANKRTARSGPPGAQQRARALVVVTKKRRGQAQQGRRRVRAATDKE